MSDLREALATLIAEAKESPRSSRALSIAINHMETAELWLERDENRNTTNITQEPEDIAQARKLEDNGA